ncbi:S-layer homology domain-containing protein [Niallia endozanthoxylica]|uniref:S-layer homology domain-containing protein n=1 Tax=Niallia endozanthoxylica TaxID=2036016 RepID=A0A5J5H4C3_9BACI|nr:S-layer homology domain-containing protein [Niallia endozanthoxylica]KAA9015489.1 S-layer homology domain-containing protein [Niallia endozanthoxylica]
MKKVSFLVVLLIFALNSFGGSALASTFTDLQEGQRFYEEMVYLEGEGIITGFPDETFRPDEEVTRAAAAIMIGRALDLDGKQRDTSFLDVSADQKASGYIAAAVEKGIIQGFEDNTYRPNQTVTRGQMAIFLSRAFELTVESDASFKDISPSMKSYTHIKRIIAENLTQGYPDNTFRPDAKVTRAQFSAFLARALDDKFKVEMPPAQMSYLKDPSKVYYYESDYMGSFYMEYPNEEYDGWNLWDVYTDYGYGYEFGYSLLEREDSEGYYLGYPESEYYMDLKYPVVVGQTWGTGYDDEIQYVITSTNMTVTTAAGTFDNVVEVTSNDELVTYFAPNVGRIKEVYEGYTVTELTQIENQ